MNFKGLVVITHSLKVYYEHYYPCLIGRIQVVLDAADPIEDEQNPLHLPVKGQRTQLGYVGHLYSGKGMEIILKLAIMCSCADFHIIGGNNDAVNYWQRICVNNQNIIFHGYVNHKNVTRYILSFDVFFESRKHYE